MLKADKCWGVMLVVGSAAVGKLLLLLLLS